ncbi:MAG: CAP domain-containing protein, partial [Olsenella sp.]|nr:CAP domain-containing protein [Olsenella sp.]
MQELRSLYKELPAHPSVSNGYWSSAPDVNAYEAGTLSSESLAFAQAYLNLIRRSANLDDVTFESTLNANASQGALILARLDSGLTHYPSTPSGVTDAQAAPGKYACSSSNLSYSRGYSNPLQTALQGQMDDEGSSNMSRVGHRRWLLYPATKTMGIGSALSESGSMFTDVRVFGQSGGDASYGYVSEDNSVSYDYVAWPASGAFLNDLFAPGTPWSVSLNTSRYDLPNASSVKVQVKRLSDGKTWNLDNADSAVTTTGEYFAVENSGYGTPGCIIFNPGSANLGANEYAGSYAVEITGLKTLGGADTSISYQVDFDSAQIDLNRSGVTVSSIPNATYTGSEIEPAVDVACDGKRLAEGRDYELSYSNNVDAGKASVTVTGVGDYKGEIAKSFTIMPRDLSGAEVSVASRQTYTGWTVEPAPTVRLGN